MADFSKEATRRSGRSHSDSGDLTLNYYEAGAATGLGAGLPLVMLHGGGPGASAWSNFGAILPRFAADLRTLLVDQPGFGQSEKAKITRNYYEFAADAVVGLMDEIGLEKVHLLGNSLGGGTAARFALKYPERLGRLILMGPGGLSLNLFHADPTEGIKRLYDFGADPTRESLRAFISTMVVNQDLVTDELVEERFIDATAPGAREAMGSMGKSFMGDDWESSFVWRDAHKIKHHTLLTWGREDRVNPVDGAFVALKLIPRASLHVFPRCGHWAQVEAAEGFHAVSRAFLAAHVERPRKESTR